MKISLVGGSGGCGSGFALRWAAKHEIIIGSRSSEKAEESAKRISGCLAEQGVDASVIGTDNKSGSSLFAVGKMNLYKISSSMTCGSGSKDSARNHNHHGKLL